MSLTIDQTAATCAARLAASASPRLASSRSMASASRFSTDSSFEHIVEDYQLDGVRAHPSMILMSTAKRAPAVGFDRQNRCQLFLSHSQWITFPQLKRVKPVPRRPFPQ